MPRKRYASGALTGPVLAAPVAPGALSPLPAYTASHFDAGTIGALGLARNGNFIPRWPGEAYGKCRDRLITQGGNVYQTGSPGHGPGVYVGRGDLLYARCQFWPAGENNIFAVFAAIRGSESIIASQTAGYETGGGCTVEIIEDRLCVSQRGGQPVLQSSREVTHEHWKREATPHLAHVHIGAGGRWRLYVDGVLEDEAQVGRFVPEAGSRFRVGQVPVESAAFGKKSDAFVIGMSLNVAGAVSQDQHSRVEEYAAARWGVALGPAPPQDDWEPPAGDGSRCPDGYELLGTTCYPEGYFSDDPPPGAHDESDHDESAAGGDAPRVRFVYWPLIVGAGLVLLLKAAEK